VRLAFLHRGTGVILDPGQSLPQQSYYSAIIDCFEEAIELLTALTEHIRIVIAQMQHREITPKRRPLWPLSILINGLWFAQVNSQANLRRLFPKAITSLLKSEVSRGDQNIHGDCPGATMVSKIERKPTLVVNVPVD